MSANKDIAVSSHSRSFSKFWVRCLSNKKSLYHLIFYSCPTSFWSQCFFWWRFVLEVFLIPSPWKDNVKVVWCKWEKTVKVWNTVSLILSSLGWDEVFWANYRRSLAFACRQNLKHPLLFKFCLFTLVRRSDNMKCLK